MRTLPGSARSEMLPPCDPAHRIAAGTSPTSRTVLQSPTAATSKTARRAATATRLRRTTPAMPARASRSHGQGRRIRSAPPSCRCKPPLQYSAATSIYAWLGQQSQKRRRLRASRNHNLVSLAAAEEACTADQSCGGVSDLYCNGTARLANHNARSA